MPALGRCSLAGVIVAALVGSGCGGDPPEKEMQQAEGAIAAARAAGADQYAHDEFSAAEDALKHAHQAVDDHDYRLALNHALDARERAQNAAKEAADQKAVARVDADRALRDTTTALADARAKLKAAETTRVPAKALAGPRRTIDDADASLQKARAAFSGGDYQGVPAMLEGTPARLHAATREIDGATGAAGRRRR